MPEPPAAHLRYVIGDATRPEGSGPRAIAHLCNDIGAWWRGNDTIPFKLGQVQFVAVEPELWVANLIGQHDIRRARGIPPIRYEAVRAGLVRVADFALEHGATVHLPRIGAGLAGGDWATIERSIVEELSDQGIAVTVYDLP